MDKFIINYNLNEKFLQIEVYGNTSLNDLIKILNYLKDYPILYSTDIKLLLDFRQMRINYFGIKELIKPFIETINNFHFIKIAKLIDTPYETAITYLLIEKINFLSNLDIKLFCTSHEALNWLNVNVNEMYHNEPR